VPALTTTLTIPLLVTVPNAAGGFGAGCPKPPTGYPVVIFQHGITRDRLDALLVADSFADFCYVVAAIDLPLHGITDPTNPFYQAANERTFNLDLNNSPSGIDSSGSHFINLTSPLTSRDNLREAAADLLTLTASLPSLKFTTDSTPDIDGNNIHFLGHSLGAIVGTTYMEFAAAKTGTLGMPGGVLAQLVLDSVQIGAEVIPGAEQLVGAPQGTEKFYQFFRDFQAVVDSGDPVNHVANAVATHPIHEIKVDNDQVVPNSATNALVVAAGLQSLCTAGSHPVSPGHGAYVTFLPPANHGSLIDPSPSYGAFAEMQTESVLFAASATAPGGPYVSIGNPAVVDATVTGCM
jgi:pimeloyl-ACP methyl ester carboxylesterase